MEIISRKGINKVSINTFNIPAFLIVLLLCLILPQSVPASVSETIAGEAIYIRVNNDVSSSYVDAWEGEVTQGDNLYVGCSWDINAWPPITVYYNVSVYDADYMGLFPPGPLYYWDSFQHTSSVTVSVGHHAMRTQNITEEVGFKCLVKIKMWDSSSNDWYDDAVIVVTGVP